MTAAGRRAAEEAKEIKSVAFPVLRAHFLRTWGVGMYLNSAWPTRDGVIPWTTFFSLLMMTPVVEAADRVRRVDELTTAVAITFGDKVGSAKAQKAVKQWLELAWPVEHHKRVEAEVGSDADNQ